MLFPVSRPLPPELAHLLNHAPVGMIEQAIPVEYLPLRDVVRELYQRATDKPDDIFLRREIERLETEMTVRYSGRTWRRFVARALNRQGKLHGGPHDFSGRGWA